MNHKASQALAFSLILIALFARVIPHAPNFSPVLAVALFSGAMFKNRIVAVLVPVFALLVSNIVLGFSLSAFTSLVLIGGLVFVGVGGKKSRKAWLSRSIAGPLLFFVLSNFFVWLSGELYPRTVDGLISCYVMAIPYLKNSLLSTVLYSVLLFEGVRFLSIVFNKRRASLLERTQ